MHLCHPICPSVWHMITQQVAEKALHVLDRSSNPELTQVIKPHVASHVWGVGRKLMFYLLCQHPVEYGSSGFHQAWPAKPLQCMPMHQIWRLYSRDNMPLPSYSQPRYSLNRKHDPFLHCHSKQQAYSTENPHESRLLIQPIAQLSFTG